jgi:tetratricopeptide (TPR) repeat protein
MGLMHQSHGAHELAQRCFTDALRVEPTFVTPEIQDELVHRSEDEVAQWYYRLSQDLKQQGYSEEAERIYRALLQWRPQEYAAYYLLGNLLARSQRLDQAFEAFRNVPSQDKHYVEARIRAATVLKLQGKTNEAYTVLFETARMHPTEGRLFVQMGKILYDMNKLQASARAFERAVQLMPKDAQSHYLLGFVYNALNRESWALAAWRKAVELAPNAHSLRYDLGYMYVRRGRYDLAAKEFGTVLNHWPDDVETNFMLGLCFKEMMDPARAIPLFEKVLRRNPRHTQALYYLGASYLQIGNTSLGKAYLRRYDYLVNQEQLSNARKSARTNRRPAMVDTKV